MNALAARYLYGLDNPLEPKLLVAYVTALVRVAQANGIVESESRILRAIADSLGAPPFLLTDLMSRRDETDFQTSMLRLRTRPSMIVMLLRDAMLIVDGDGWISDEESEAMAGMVKMLGITEDQRARAVAACEQLELLRRKMAGL